MNSNQNKIKNELIEWRENLQQNIYYIQEPNFQQKIPGTNTLTNEYREWRKFWIQKNIEKDPEAMLFNSFDTPRRYGKITRETIENDELFKEYITKKIKGV